MINVIPGHFEEIVPILIQSEKVEEIYEVHGQYIAIVKISTNNLNEMREEIVKIRKIPNVTESEMITILKIWKNI